MPNGYVAPTKEYPQANDSPLDPIRVSTISDNCCLMIYQKLHLEGTIILPWRNRLQAKKVLAPHKTLL